jgi:preprotein translocase subunit SecY
MIQAFLNIFRVPELRKKILFTLFMLMIYRIGYHVTLPGVDQAGIAAAAQNQDDTSAAGRLANYVSLFAGGNLQNATIFSLGIMPYISSSIIFQLLGTVVPTLEKMQKEGETGRRKIQEWSRYVTVPLCIVQAIFLLSSLQSGRSNSALVLPLFRRQMAMSFWMVGLIGMTAGSVFLMWLGEQIDEYGLGNGVSFVILAGIVARMPNAVGLLVSQTSLQGTGTKQITPGKILFLVLCFVFVIAGSILITQAQRRIPIQQAKHTRGRRVYGGQKQYLPLRVNHGGVMPIIFAQSLMLFPGVALSSLATRAGSGTYALIIRWFNDQFALSRGGFLYLATESAMIYFFAYFWTTVQFQP